MTQLGRDDVAKLAAQTRCAVCKTPYGREGISIMGRRGAAWMIAVTCPHCATEGLLIATVDGADAETTAVEVGDQEESAPNIMYDVTYDEWMAFQEMPPVSYDDVLDVHLFLENFDGDFSRLFDGDPDDEETTVEDNVT